MRLFLGFKATGEVTESPSSDQGLISCGRSVSPLDFYEERINLAPVLSATYRHKWLDLLKVVQVAARNRAINAQCLHKRERPLAP